MEEFWILIFVSFFAIYPLDKVESVQLEELPLQTFDELFVDEWLDKDEAEDLKTPAQTNFGQNVHHQIDRQNTQIGQIEPNSTDQNAPLTESDHPGQIEPNSTDQNAPLIESDHPGQIEPNSSDQNPPLTESDHSDNAKNSEEQNEITNEITSNENIAENERKRKIVAKFLAIKDEFKQKGKYSAKERTQIEEKIAKHLKVSRKKIFKWKKEFGLSQKKTKKERKNLVEKFDQRKAELKRAGFKNSYNHEIDKTVAKELGLNFRTIYKWKRKLGQSTTNYSDINQWKKEVGLTQRKPNERKHLVEKFDQRKAELKRDGFKSSYKNELDKTVAKELGHSFTTIYNWKRELGQTAPTHKHSDSEQLQLMKRYYEIKDQNPKINDEGIARMLKIGIRTLSTWKKQFKRQQFHQNSVDGHFVEENAAANVQEIENSNSESI